MLVAVLMIFLVFSFTGVAVLNVAYISTASSHETVNNIKLQYATESSINEALWRINTGVDSLVNNDVDGISTLWNPSLNILSVNVDRFQMETEILLDLSATTHFDRGIAAEESVILDGYDPGLTEDKQVRGGFNFLPEVDLQYFIDNAKQMYSTDNKTYSHNTFTKGIHVFTGNHLTISDIKIQGGTLVFTGYDITFLNDNYIVAPPADTSGVLPALIFTHPNQDFSMYSHDGDETIIGAIYCKGDVELHNGNVSGPVIGRNVTLGSNIDFMDSEHSEHYQWTKGFGHKDSYDWPKKIGRWKTSKWGKKNNI